MDILALFFHWAMWFQVDDSLEPGAKRWLEISAPAERSDAYIYLLGMGAGPNENPYVVGRTVYQEIKKAEQSYLSAKDGYRYDVPELVTATLALPDFLKACYQWCINHIYNVPDPAAQLKQHQVLLERTQTFLAYDDYHTLSLDLLESPLPSYQYLVAGNRLLLLKALTAARAGNGGQAVDELLKTIGDLRRGLARSDNLIHQMIFVKMLSESLDMLSLVINEFPVGQLERLKVLEPHELNFETVFANEFAFSYYITEQLKYSPYLFKTSSIDDMSAIDDSALVSGLPIPRWWSRIVFKPNMTANSGYKLHLKALAQSENGAIAFSDKVLEPLLGPKSNRLRNIVGSVLIDVGSPDLRQYVARVFDLNAKIVLLNYIIDRHNTANKDLPLPSNNPYYAQPSPAYIPKEDSGKLCFKGPLPDRHDGRCLMIKPPYTPNTEESP